MKAAMTYTRHARSRSQQRAIAPFIADLLLQFGTSARHDGADVYYFDKPARKNVRRYLGEKLFGRVEDQIDVYAVVGDEGRIVTLGHRTVRFNRT